MKCPNCQTENGEAAKYCGECGTSIKSGAAIPFPASGASVSLEENQATGDEEAFKPPSGFSRTISSELVARQIEMRTSVKLSALIQGREFRPGEVLMRKGEKIRDLFFLTEGVVAISRQEGEEDIVLNEIEPPYILGEVAFLFGMPRTATATAKTGVKTYVLKYEDLKELVKDFPEWLYPLLTSLASDIKSLHHKSKTLEKKLLEVEPGSAQRA